MMDMKNNKAMFIKTKDEETSETLKAEGFYLVDYTSGVWTFLYDENRPMTFDNNKIAYSNMLCF
jgi:hypothetical protein